MSRSKAATSGNVESRNCQSIYRRKSDIMLSRWRKSQYSNGGFRCRNRVKPLGIWTLANGHAIVLPSLKKNNLDASQLKNWTSDQSPACSTSQSYLKGSLRRSCRNSSTNTTCCRPLSPPTASFSYWFNVCKRFYKYHVFHQSNGFILFWTSVHVWLWQQRRTYLTV